MSIKEDSTEGGIWVIEVSGRLDQGQTQDLEKIMMSHLASGHRWLIINLSGLEYVNSGGLRCLVTAWRQAQKQDGLVVLCELSARISDVFQTVGFDKVFQIYQSCEDARRAFGNP